jgi:ferredoxin
MSTWKSIARSNLPAFLSKLQKGYDVFAPVRRDEELRIRQLPAKGEIYLGVKKPLLPLKTLFQPEVEDLFTFTLKGTIPDITPAERLKRERIILGCLGCDIAALDILDSVFLDEHEDTEYKKRREQTILIAMACTGEGPECFCTSFGITPLQPAGADALLFDTGRTYLLKILSNKGKKINKAVRSLLKEPSKKELSLVKAASVDPQSELSIDKVPHDTEALWDLPVWEELANYCLGCGVCTVLCPTCHCFDVEDERRGSAGKRYRFWDSCMNPNFTKMASGENPRPSKRERVRQRFMHKLCYFFMNKKQLACVGCGRCAVQCPVGIGINRIITELSTMEEQRG